MSAEEDYYHGLKAMDKFPAKGEKQAPDSPALSRKTHKIEVNAMFGGQTNQQSPQQDAQGEEPKVTSFEHPTAAQPQQQQ